MTMKNWKIYLLIVTVSALYACGSSKSLTKEAKSSASSAQTYSERVLAQDLSAKAVTAKLKVEINAAGRNISAGGTLRMLRDDVIQLSVSILGIEVGRMEFTTDEVLVVDRINSEYVRVPYNKVSFLQKAQLDFYALQALFWNEVFIPGVRPTASGASRFRLSESGNYTQLNLSDTPQLEYAFLTNATTHKLERTTVKSKNISDPTQLVCRYAKFEQLAGKLFPAFVEFVVTGTGKDYNLTLQLSRLDTSTQWDTRTKVSSRYTERSVDDILRKLMSM